MERPLDTGKARCGPLLRPTDVAGQEPVAAIFDDGHRMSAREFTRRWLVGGTESKATANHTPV